MRRLAFAALGVVLVAGVACTGGTPDDPIRIGAVYPLSGTQGPGGVEEFHGVQTAIALANADGGVDGGVRSSSRPPIGWRPGSASSPWQGQSAPR